MPHPNRQQTNRTQQFMCLTSRLIFTCDSSDETKNCLFVSKPVGHTHVFNPGQIRFIPFLVPAWSLSATLYGSYKKSLCLTRQFVFKQALKFGSHRWRWTIAGHQTSHHPRQQSQNRCHNNRGQQPEAIPPPLRLVHRHRTVHIFFIKGRMLMLTRVLCNPQTNLARSQRLRGWELERSALKAQHLYFLHNSMVFSFRRCLRFS